LILEVFSVPSTVAEITGLPVEFSQTDNSVKLNFTMFTIEFDKKSGSSIIYGRDGSVLVYYHFMILQYFNEKVGEWRQAGTFKSLSCRKHDDYHYSVEEYFIDYSTSPQTNYTIIYDIRSDSRVKITVRIENGASRRYRLQWSLDGVKYSDWKEKKNADNVKHQLLFGDEFKDYEWIAFDWQDIYEQFKSDIASYNVDVSAKGRKADIYFELGIVKTGSVLTVDPSLVGTSTSNVATSYPFQHKSFYAAGRFWVFYSDGTNMVYRTSTDGITWTSDTAVRAATAGYLFSVWFDGTYLHYAYAAGTSIYYRRGTPNSDGTITWSADEQTVPTKYNQARFPMVSVDSNGYVWIGYIDFTSSYYYPYVIKSGNNDGTWGTTPSGFPYQLSTTSSNNWGVSVISLTSGKMLVIYGSQETGTVKARRWDGSAWGTEVATTSAIQAGYYHSAVAQGDDVHLVFLKYSTYDVIYTKYSYATNSFSAEVTLRATATLSSAPVISIDTVTNDLYVFWAGYPTANHIYFRKYTASTGTWETAVDWIAETETLTGNDRLTCFYQAYSNKIGLVYMTRTASPYNVKFAFLSFAVAYTITLTESLGLKDSTVKASSVRKSELLGLKDTTIKSPSVVKRELLGLSDVAVKNVSVAKAESLGLLDYYSMIWSVRRTYSENLGLADNVQKSPSTVKSEPLGLSDVVQKSPSILKLELLGLSDFYSRTWTAHRTYIESLGLSDKVSKTAAVPLAETLWLFDTVAKSSFIMKVESLGLADFTVKSASATKTEMLGLSDVFGKEAGKVFSEPLGLKDVFGRTVQRTYIESLGLKDTVSKGVALHALAEVLSLYDRVVYAPNVTVLAKLIRKYIQLVSLGGDWNE
jgi:hypothetical protein